MVLILFSSITQDIAELDRYLSTLPIAHNAAFNSRERQHDDLCLQNTRVDLLEEIRQWVSRQDGRNIFWLNGLAGTGKSTIARTVAREYYDQKRLGASFFFSRGGGDVSHAGKFFTSLALQLAATSPSLKHHICEAVAENSHIAHQSLRDQWRQLILQPLLRTTVRHPSLVIVVDALDECDGANDVRTILQLFAEVGTLNRVRLQVFLTSRPEIPIRYGFYQVPDSAHQDFILHSISPQVINHDIFLFFEHKFNILKQEQRLAEDWPGHQNIRALVQKAAGLFIWAATAYRFVCEGRYAKRRLSRLLEGSNSPTKPERRLDEIYLTVLKSSISQDYEEEEKAELCDALRTTLGTIAILFAPLSLLSLGRLFRTSPQHLGRMLDDLHSILDIPEDQSLPIRLHHPSFRDFLLDNERCNDSQFSVDEKIAHGALANACIQLMSESLGKDICGLRAPGTIATDVQQTVTQCLPTELQYACLYWIQHAQKSGIRLEDDGQVHAFLQKHLLHWLEVLSLMQKTSEAVLALISLDSMDPVSGM